MNPKLEAAIERAVAAFAETMHQAPSARASVLRRVAEIVDEREAALVELVIDEARKPRQLAVAEVKRLRQTLEFGAHEALHAHAGELLALDASVAGAGHRGWTRRVPIGLILGVTPFNFPLNLVAHKVVPAVASGNVILIKPSPRTPRCAQEFARLFAEAGAIPNQVQALPFDHELVAPLLADARVKMLSFTGSGPVGWGLKKHCERARVTLELGGNAAVIVHGDARWRDAIPLIAAGAFGYAGQSCISVQRVFVQAKIYEEFRAAFLQYVADEVKTGDPHEEHVMNGPLIDDAARKRVIAWAQEACAAGGRLLTDLRVDGDCVWPLVFEDVSESAKIVAEEAFAPLAVLQRYEEFDEAVTLVNRSRFGLQAGVFTDSLTLAEKAAAHIEAGAVLINQVPTFRVENMPYGGVKESGFGREGIRYAMEEMTECKTVIVRQW